MLKAGLKIIFIFSILFSLVHFGLAVFSDSEKTSAQFSAAILKFEIKSSGYKNGQANLTSTWDSRRLAVGDWFLKYSGIKPGDWGAEGMGFKPLGQNMYACMKLSLLKDDENSALVPEIRLGDLPDDTINYLDGELGDELQMIFWADDGDNVLETNETDRIIAQGTATEIFDGKYKTLSDSSNNWWTGVRNSPLSYNDPNLADGNYHIGQAWCLGSLSLNPVAFGEGESPEVDPGITCSPLGADSKSQSDLLSADVEFQALQSAGNDFFLCNP